MSSSNDVVVFETTFIGKGMDVIGEGVVHLHFVSIVACEDGGIVSEEGAPDVAVVDARDKLLDEVLGGGSMLQEFDSNETNIRLSEIAPVNFIILVLVEYISIEETETNEFTITAEGVGGGENGVGIDEKSRGSTHVLLVRSFGVGKGVDDLDGLLGDGVGSLH